MNRSYWHLVEYLERPVEVDLHPAGRLLDRLPVVVGAPALHEGQPEAGVRDGTATAFVTKISPSEDQDRTNPDGTN